MRIHLHIRVQQRFVVIGKCEIRWSGCGSGGENEENASHTYSHPLRRGMYERHSRSGFIPAIEPRQRTVGLSTRPEEGQYS